MAAPVLPLRNATIPSSPLARFSQARVAQLAGELPDLSPVAFGGQNVPFEIDVALDGESAQPQPRVLLCERALEIGGDLFGDVGKGKRLHLAAQSAELGVQRVAAIAGLGRGLFDFSVDREGVVPVRQPGEPIGFSKTLLSLDSALTEGRRGDRTSAAQGPCVAEP